MGYSGCKYHLQGNGLKSFKGGRLIDFILFFSYKILTPRFSHLLITSCWDLFISFYGMSNALEFLNLYQTCLKIAFLFTLIPLMISPVINTFITIHLQF